MLSEEIRRIHSRVEQMRQSHAKRDIEMDRVRLIRRGRMHELHPEFFADDLPESVVSNVIDVAARDTAELMSPLPSLACASGNMVTTSDEKRAALKNKIGSYYWEKSRLSTQQIPFCDSVNAYASGAYLVEPDFIRKCPMIRFESPFGAYHYKDRWGNLVWYAKIASVTAGELAAMFPEKENVILRKRGAFERQLTDRLEMVRYMDREETVVFLPDCNYEILLRVKNPLSRVPVVVATRPDLDDPARGQYDDVVWPSIARSRMAQYMLKAADTSVNAPLAIPMDVTEVNTGPDAFLRSDMPEKIRRIALDIPQDVFALSMELDKEVREGARYPEARTGGVEGNIITGRGVQALMGTMDTQVRTMQTIVGQALEEVTSLCFELDVALWPNTRKTITGVLTGKPFEVSYTPAKDIGEYIGCKVTYGMAAGLSPSQAIVALLQLDGGQIISKDTLRRQLPFDVDPEDEQRAIDTQDMENGLKQGFLAYMQAMGPMVAQGLDIQALLLGGAKAVTLRQQGVPLADAIQQAMAPPEKEDPPNVPAQGGLPGIEQGGPPGAPPQPGELPPNVNENGLMRGVAYGQQGQAPGGMPDIQSLISTLRSQGAPKMEASTMIKRATG